MKNIIIAVAVLTSTLAISALAETARNDEAEIDAVMSVENAVEPNSAPCARRTCGSSAERAAARRKAKAEKATGREKAEAKRLGYLLEDWCSLSKKARRDIRQKARAKELGLTVEEMKAEATRKEAEKVGCPVEKWAAMTLRDRIAYRKQAKAAASSTVGKTVN